MRPILTTGRVVSVIECDDADVDGGEGEGGSRRYAVEVANIDPAKAIPGAPVLTRVSFAIALADGEEAPFVVGRAVDIRVEPTRYVHEGQDQLERLRARRCRALFDIEGMRNDQRQEPFSTYGLFGSDPREGRIAQLQARIAQIDAEIRELEAETARAAKAKATGEAAEGEAEAKNESESAL